MTEILLLGDSLIADNDWQARMPSYKVTNLGVPGARTSDLYVALPAIKEQVGHADIITIMVGTNDLLSGNFAFINTLKKIFVRLNKDFPIAEIIVSSLFPMELPDEPDYTIPKFNSHIEAFTMQTGSCFLDTYSRFKNSNQPIFQEDGIHITKEAYELWARALLEHIAFLLEND